jgi:hypothetical protein
MDDFAQEMSCVVRRLFPDDDKENVPPNYQPRRRHLHLPPDHLGQGKMHADTADFNLNLNKRKRTAVIATSSPSPLREIRNEATIKTKNAVKNGAHRCNSTENHIYRSKGGVLTIKADNLRHDRRVPVITRPPRQSFTILDDSKIKIYPGPYPIESECIHKVKSSEEDAFMAPAEEFLDKFDYVLSNRYPDGTDFLLIRDALLVSDDDGHGGVAPMDINLEELSKEQLTTIRVLIVPLQRRETMDQMGKLILGDSFGQDNINYDRIFWFSVLKSYRIFKRSYASEPRGLAGRFNLLFGFTYYLALHPHWMTHHARGWGGEKMVAGLASRWKQLLKYSPGQLGLDKEYSYPALLCFLEEFKTKVEAADTNGDPKLQFDYEKLENKMSG